MFPRPRKVALTLLCLAVALGLATVSEANSFVHPARDHVDLSRMIKKRSPQLLGIGKGVVGAEADPTSTLATSATTANTATSIATLPATSTSSSTDATTSATTSSTAATSATTSSSSTSVGDVTVTLGVGIGSSSSSSTTSSSTTSSSTESTTSTSTSSSATPTTTSNVEISVTPVPSDTQTSSRHTSTNFVTVTASSDASQSTEGAQTTGASSNNGGKITKTTLIVIAVIASTIGGIALAWTIFRKWKLRPSSNFDDRMQPIDWQPTTSEDGGIRRNASTASHGSFQSSSHGHGDRLQPLPEHDFTAGASTLAPVGGYADLQRGPSPQPNMAELNRGPSMNRPGYDYGMPMQHGGYDYNQGMRY
ncbi:hypothetical protein BD413DRAFT_601164 [Trametes elegans]|nr:hypothetical protein BD413DRAFT_601164 [Trametes elegans]